MTKLIYETKGRAREFCEYALNHYSGCGHGCIYCYAPDVLHTKPESFWGQPKARVTVDAVREDAARVKAAGVGIQSKNSSGNKES